MSNLIKAQQELDTLAKQSLIAVRFQENREANFYFVLTMLKGPRLYQNGKLYLASFTNAHADLRLLSLLIAEIRDWRKVTIFANGRPQTSKFNLLNVLTCYLTAKEASNYKDHCHQVISDPFTESPDKRTMTTSLTIDIFDNEFRAVQKRAKDKWLLPCKHLHGFLDFDRTEKPRAQKKLEAVAVERNCNLCPFFKSDEFSSV